MRVMIIENNIEVLETTGLGLDEVVGFDRFGLLYTFYFNEEILN